MIDTAKLAQLKAQGITVIIDPPPAPDHSRPMDQRQRIFQTGPVQINGQWRIQSQLRTLTQEERVQYLEQSKTAVRSQRDKFLRKSDIYVLPDRWTAYSPEQQAYWSQIRQGLRDLTSQQGFPYDITWPQMPETLFND